MIGQTIHNYKIYSQIGEGGMGTVYLAKHSTLERLAAIKVLLKEYANNPEIKQRFINEANTLSKLSHLNIVSLYDFAEINNDLFLIMEYIEGVPLNDYISETKEINIHTTLNIFKQILDGFEYAHNIGVIHRDIKPSNIILQKDNTPKILDFGIAKIIQGDIKLTRTGLKMGSLLYMSPEQILGEEIDIRTDIYSLGILLYEMLTRNFPYDVKTKSDYEVMDKILKQEIPLININSYEDIGIVIQKACQKNRQDRYQSLSAFKNDLSACKLFRESSATKYEVKTTNSNSFNQASSTTIIQGNYQNKTQDSKSNNSKSLILLFAGIVIIAIIIFITLGRNNDSDNIEVISKGTLNNQEKGTNPTSSANETTLIKERVISLLSETEQKSDKIIDYYANNVNYYKIGFVSINAVMSDKKKFFKKWDLIVLKPEDINISKENNNKYVCDFDKYFKASNYSGKYHEGRVKSRLVFEKVNNNWLITTETDDLIYWTNKN